MAYPKFCIRCHKRYQPTGKVQRICEKCLKKSYLKAKNKRMKNLMKIKENERIDSLKLQNTSNLLNKAS